MERHLHIVCLDVPFPPDYGGVFDLFFKLKYLHEAGIIIHLHCYEYGRGKQDALLQYCHTVQYYRRSRSLGKLITGTPYIVGSRSDPALINNLRKDDYPVILEGIHCTWLLHERKLGGRKVILRLHNIEHEYYRQLALHSGSVWRRIYFRIESVLLKNYERGIAAKPDLIVAVTQKDAQKYATEFRVSQCVCLPVFTPWNKVLCREGSGAYCLYQGNLAVSENEQAALWLIRQVFSGLNIPLIIAGRNPSGLLKKNADKYPWITVKENPSQEVMQQLIEEAQINLLPSFTTTGIKLKLLHALFCGRHCLTNSAMAEDTGLTEACTVVETAEQFRRSIELVFRMPMTKESIRQRQRLLETAYNNLQHAERLIQWIWN